MTAWSVVFYDRAGPCFAEQEDSMNQIQIITTNDQLKDVLASLLSQLSTVQLPPEVVVLEKLKRKETLTTEEVELLYGLKANTLRKRRMNGEGPAYVKDGDKILYTHSAVKKYLDSRRQKTHDQP